MWVAAAKDTDKPNPTPQREWAKDDLALSGGEGAEGLLNAEGSTQKRGEVWSEEREALMISHNDPRRKRPQRSKLGQSYRTKGVRLGER